MVTCKFENGKEAPLRHCVVDVLVVDKNKILLTRRAAHLSNPGKLSLCGGYMNIDENAIQAAEREALEETGYKVKVDYLLRVVSKPDRPAEDRQNIALVFVAHSIEKVGEHDSESTEVTWYELDKLPSEKEFAFDHHEDIEIFLKHTQTPLPLPIIS